MWISFSNSAHIYDTFEELSCFWSPPTCCLYLHRIFSDPFSICVTSPYFQVAVSRYFVWNPKAASPLVQIIPTKHHAFAPSSPMLLPIKFRFIKVEFCRRHSAKAWETKSGPRVQLFNWSNSRSSHSSLPSREFVRLLNQWISHET